MQNKEHRNDLNDATNLPDLGRYLLQRSHFVGGHRIRHVDKFTAPYSDNLYDFCRRNFKL